MTEEEVFKELEEFHIKQKELIKHMECQAEENMERLREGYNQEIKSLVQMLNEEKEKSHRKYNGMIDKGQQVELLIEQDDHKVEQPDEKSNAANEIITSGVLSDFNIGEWRRKETKWEECKKTLEENIHKLKAEIKEQNEFLEVRKKGKNQK